MQAPNDRELINRVLAKDRQAFDEFFDTYFPRLCRFCGSRISDPDAVEDIVQETLLKAMRNLHTYRGEALLFSWLAQICRNEISNWYAKTGRKTEVLVSMDDDLAVRATLESAGLDIQETMMANVGLAEMVHLALDYLPENYGRVLELKYLEGLSVKEIAARLGTGRLSTQSMLARARTAFRTCFAELQQ